MSLDYSSLGVRLQRRAATPLLSNRGVHRGGAPRTSKVFVSLSSAGYEEHIGKGDIFKDFHGSGSASGQVNCEVMGTLYEV